MLDLDAWLPDPTVRTYRCRRADATPDGALGAGAALRLADTRTLGRLIRWRIPGVSAERTYDELFRSYPFVVLEEGERHLVSGPVRADLDADPRLPAARRPRTRSATGTRRAPSASCFAHWVTDDAQLCTEARVKPVDRSSAFRLQALWRLIGHFEPLVATEPLDARDPPRRRRVVALRPTGQTPCSSPASADSPR